ncbi:MAG: phosphatase PAP2 family protein [Bacteroidota bacterium]|nr:phosphatase PAP2 family protein [Bacteroidota bacterium]MDP4229182.1 phosphatase PAP2 family protein [Bacteroidota bacterium]MDP4235506.1 phosphatase PAP2 family protein [Bacteroidota bacterium]
MNPFDFAILQFINVTLSAPWLDHAMIFLTNVRNWVPVYIVAFAFVIFKYKWTGVRMVVACLLLVGLTDLLTNRILKEIVARPRPCSLLADPSGAYSWIRTPDGVRLGYSFPSSHAVNNFAGVVFFILLFPKVKKLLWLFVPATIVALTRIYLGLHYPSDVFTGMLIGAAAGWGFAKLFGVVEKKYFSLSKIETS